jgi:SAM-dependent methyltransferase
VAEFGDPRTYHGVRPGYAPEAVARAIELLELDESARVLDLAAGTGKLSALLHPRVGELIAIDRSPEMLAVATEENPDLDARLGSAEAIPLDEPVDAVFVGEAFHWFDFGKAVPELRRILRPGGGLALLFNRERWPGDPHPWLEDFGKLLQPVWDAAGTHPRELAGWREALIERGFEPVAEEEFEHAHRVDASGFAALVGSWSFVARLDDDERERILDGVRGLVAGEGELALRYATELQLFRAAPARAASSR